MADGIANISDKELSKVSLDSFNILKFSPGAFTGGSANTRGDHDGTQDPTTLFKVTGAVLMRIFAVCTVDLVGDTATIEVGTVGNTAALIAQSTATDIDVGDIWKDTTPELGVGALADLPGPFIVTKDVIETLATANITAGSLYYVCLWRPLSPDGKVEKAA